MWLVVEVSEYSSSRLVLSKVYTNIQEADYGRMANDPKNWNGIAYDLKNWEDIAFEAKLWPLR